MYSVEQIEHAILIAEEELRCANSITEEKQIESEIEKLKMKLRKLYEDETI